MDALILDAPAKLNLRLLVGPPRRDGFHPVRTLMVALHGLCDTVTVSAADHREVLCPGIDGPRNLAWTALDALEAHTGRPLPVRVVIDKRIPAQAGLGGGSSDAAAVLAAAATIHGVEVTPADLEGVAATVGSDVPFFVRGGAQWAGGRGEDLSPARVPPFWAVIAVPPFGCPTGDVYRTFDALPAPPPGDDAPAPADAAGLAAWARNDLWPAALAMRPALGRVARAVRAAGARAALLCGSGSAVAGVFTGGAAAREAAARLTAGTGLDVHVVSGGVVPDPAAAGSGMGGLHS